jgi:RHS repeat-associated protein
MKNLKNKNLEISKIGEAQVTGYRPEFASGQGFCCEDAPQNAPARAPSANDNPELFQYYYHSDHLGSTSLITNLDDEVVQHVEYVPFGEVFIEERNNKWNTPYLFNAKELDEETGLYYYGARYYEPRISQWMSADPMQEKYPGVSSYAYCVQNPVRFIDPDGKKIRLADNYRGAMANIAQIAATSLGSQVISYLIGRNETYTMNSTFWTSSSSYNPSNRTVNYVANPLYSEIPFDGGALNSMIAMGHETFHAFDHSINVFDEAHAAYAKSTVEPRAVSFGNYLRSAYSLSPLREQYSNIKGNLHQFGANEKISNFTTLGNNADETSYGFSYTKTTTTVESYKYYFWGRVPDKTKTETATYYMTVSMDKNKNVTYQTYNNEADYQKATSNW